MSPTFTDDDVGKRVENANGEEVGVIAAIDGNTAHVDPDPGITDSIKAALGWESGSEDTLTLDAAAVSQISGNTVRLEGESLDHGKTETVGHEPIVEQHEGTGERDVGTSPGGTMKSDLEETDRRGTDIGTDTSPDEPGGADTDRGAATNTDRDAEIDPDRDAETDSDPAHGAETDTERDIGTGEGDGDDRSQADPAEEMGGADEMHPTEEMDGADEMDTVEEMDPAEGRDRGAEIDPTEVAGTDPDSSTGTRSDDTRRTDAEIDPDDEMRRTDAELEPDDDTRRTGAEIEPEGDVRRSDAELDPDAIRKEATRTRSERETADTDDETDDDWDRMEDDDSSEESRDDTGDGRDSDHTVTKDRSREDN